MDANNNLTVRGESDLGSQLRFADTPRKIAEKYPQARTGLNGAWILSGWTKISHHQPPIMRVV